MERRYNNNLSKMEIDRPRIANNGAAEMRNVILGIMMPTLLLSACAGHQQNMLPPGTTETWQGILEFSGEFRLFTDYNNKNCISGAFLLEAHERARRQYSGKRVIVSGRRVSWELANPKDLVLSLGIGGSTIENWCGGNFVIYATDVTEKL